MNDSVDILKRLVGFATVSRDSNLALIEWVGEYLGAHDIAHTLTYNDDRSKANLHAVIGPLDVPGIMLSGHTDVVPVDGQDWTSDPFTMVERDGRYFGRGTADMKGFIACVLAAVPQAVTANLKRPIHLAFSYDEEIGCIGVRRMIDALAEAPIIPGFCIIGEPTGMGVAIGHKGKTGMVCRVTGVEAHSALAPDGLNAIYLATDMMMAVRDTQAEIEETGARDPHYSVPYTTLHVGTIKGGSALNIVPKNCEFLFEIRNIQDDDPLAILDTLRQKAGAIIAKHKERFATAEIKIEIFNQYPALETSPNHDIVAFVKSLAEANDHFKVSFGTEGGLFQKRLGVPTVICGPGHMAQGHKADEFIAAEQLARCDRFLTQLIDRLSK